MAKYSNPIYFKYSDELKKALLQDDIKFLKVYGDDYTCVEYKRVVEEKPFTNADHIRAMTDEEIADWIYNITTNALRILQIGSDMSTQSYFGWLNWLKQEAKE